MKEKEYNFQAVIKSSQIGKGGAYIEFPYDVEKEFGVKGRVKVVCFFEDIKYSGSLVKMKTACHIVGVTKDIRAKLKKDISDTVSVRLYKDNSERKVEVNPVFEEKMKNDKTFKDNYEKLSYTKKKEINNSLNSAKKEETFIRRMNKILDDLKN